MTMSDNNKGGKDNPDPKISDKADELIEKGKIWADKAEDFFSEKLNKFKKSDAFGKISDAFGQVEEVMETKSQEFHSGEIGAKFEAFKEKAGDPANELLKKAKETGLKIGDAIDEQIDALKGKKDQRGNQNGGGI
jgi:hypothetical protein